jgi:hypothetical protein
LIFFEFASHTRCFSIPLGYFFVYRYFRTRQTEL